MPCLPSSGKLFMVANSLILLIAHTYARWQAVTQLTLQQTKYYLTKIALGSSCFTASLTCLVMFLNILLQNNFMDYFLCCVFFPPFNSFLLECSPLPISSTSLVFYLGGFLIHSFKNPSLYQFLSALLLEQWQSCPGVKLPYPPGSDQSRSGSDTALWRHAHSSPLKKRTLRKNNTTPYLPQPSH